MINKKISDDKILEKAEQWELDGLTQPGAMRLYTYLELDKVPTHVIERLSDEAVEVWNDDLGVEDLEADIEVWIATAMTEFGKLNIVTGLTFVTPILADLYVLGHSVGGLEGRYRSLTKTFYRSVIKNRAQAEINIIKGISKLLKDAALKVGVKLSYDLDIVVQQINERNELEKKALRKQGQGNVSQENLGAIIDKAIEEYDKETGGDLLADINQDPEKDLLELDTE